VFCRHQLQITDYKHTTLWRLFSNRIPVVIFVPLKSPIMRFFFMRFDHQIC